MAASSTAVTPHSAASVFPNSENLNHRNEPSPSTDFSEPSKPSPSSGKSSPADSPSPGKSSPADSPSPDSNESIIIVREDVSSQSYNEEEEEEEEEECGFCLYMKGGGCKEPFIAWEKCMKEAEKIDEDVVNKCGEVITLLRKCMDEHADYYEPILRVEREMEDAASEINTGNSEKETVSKLHNSPSNSDTLISDST
ncbi:hypothetical protein KSP39_PZI020496 [Platanthera zijinensis]|uniref:GCK domain-containing protein n=1 Tax=Platanthera zijinensis TaxID=2320716 RepID=A0AAP0AZQ2_9ASPA